jgi:hypothetical protein
MGGIGRLGLVELAEEGGQDVGGLQVVVVVGPVEVGGHGADEVAAMLAPEGLAELDAGDLGDGVPLVGGLERPGQEVFFLEGLGGHFGIDAGAPEEEQLADAGAAGPVDQVVLDLEVLEEEGGGLGAVGEDAAHLGGGHEDELGPLLGEEAIDGGGVEEIEFLAGAAQEMAEALPFQLAPDGAPGQAPVPGHVDAGVRGECHGAGN